MDCGSTHIGSQAFVLLHQTLIFPVDVQHFADAIGCRFRLPSEMTHKNVNNRQIRTFSPCTRTRLIQSIVNTGGFHAPTTRITKLITHAKSSGAFLYFPFFVFLPFSSHSLRKFNAETIQSPQCNRNPTELHQTSANR
jgi:hypothetical protein